MCHRSINIGKKALSLFVIVLLSFSCQAKLFNLTTESPNHTYVVSLNEVLNPPGEPYNYMVSLKISKGNQPIASVPRFDGRDNFDRRFGNEYPESFWLSENVLRLSDTKEYTIENCDRIIVRNETSKVVSYFMVSAKSEMFLVLELKPQATLTLYAQPQTDRGADLSYIGYAGQFNDGNSISSGGMNFRIRGRYMGATHYCVTIKNEEVVVRSRVYEGVRFLNGVEKKFPMVSDCGE